MCFCLTSSPPGYGNGGGGTLVPLSPIRLCLFSAGGYLTTSLSPSVSLSCESGVGGGMEVGVGSPPSAHRARRAGSGNIDGDGESKFIALSPAFSTLGLGGGALAPLFDAGASSTASISSKVGLSGGMVDFGPHTWGLSTTTGITNF